MSLDATLSALSGSLDETEAALKLLLARPLEDTLSDLPGPIERAKVLFWVSYAIHSCSWVHAKLKAADLEEHGVLDELKRIQGYNGKINAASKALEAASEQAGPSKDQMSNKDERTMKVDKDAANRFISAAISNQPKKPESSSSFYTANAQVTDPLAHPNDTSSNADATYVGTSTRLSSFQRQSGREERSADTKDDNDDSSSSSSENDDLKVIDGDAAPQDGTTGGKHRRSADGKDQKGRKRKRKTADADGVNDNSPVVQADPLQGYDVDPATAGGDTAVEQTVTNKKKKKENRLKQLKEAASARALKESQAGQHAGAVRTTGSETEPSTKKEKKRRRKDRRAEASDIVEPDVNAAS